MNKRATNWLEVIIAGALAGLMAGCASVPEASPARQAQALSFEPLPGEAGVYIICPSYLLGGRALWDVCLDRQKTTSLAIKSFVCTSVWPGEHTISSGDPGDHSSITFVASEGQNSFVTVGPSFSGNQFKLIPTKTGENYARNYELSGDDFYRLPFLPGAADSSTPVTCHIMLSQDDPFVMAQVEQPSDDNAEVSGPTVSGKPAQAGAEIGLNVGEGIAEGLGDSIINGLINEAYAAKAKKLSLPLQGHGLGELFSTNFQSSFAAAAAKSPWLHTSSVDIGEENTNVAVPELGEYPSVQVNVIYALSPDASALIMRAQLLYFRQGETNATYGGLYTYLSQPMSAEDNKAITQWAASNQALLRQRMDEGINELMMMMDIDFFHRQKMDSSARSELAFYVDPLKGEKVTRQGFILKGEGPRIILQRYPGKMISVVVTMPPQPLE